MTLVCNNFLKDLTHPNEYIAGRGLRLIANIQSKFIMETLLEPILEKCLQHVDVYVRRNAVVCLIKMFQLYGEQFLPDIGEKLQKQLEKENDLTTKRNIFFLFFNLDREKATTFLLEKISEEEHEEFGDILQLIIIKSIQDATIKDKKTSGTFTKIIKAFSNSKFNSVLYEVAYSLIRFTRTTEALRSAVVILVQILKNNNDNNVKLLIIEQLEIIRRRDKLILMDSFIDLAQMVFLGDGEIKEKFLPFMESYTTKDNIAVVQKTLFHELKECLSSKSDQKEYQAKIILFVNSLVERKIISEKTFFADVLPMIIQNPSYAQNIFDLIRIVLQNIYQTLQPDAQAKFNEIFKNSLQEIKDQKICSLALNHLGSAVKQTAAVQDIIGILIESVGSLPLRKRETKEAVQKEEEPSEKKFIRKTVVREDGTYGEELVEITAEQVRSNNFRRLRTTEKKRFSTKLESSAWTPKTSA
jgi:coatomer subunit beta